MTWGLLCPSFVGSHHQADASVSRAILPGTGYAPAWFSITPVPLQPWSHLGLDGGHTAYLAITLSHSSARGTTFPLGPLESPIGFWKSILAAVQFSGHLNQASCQSLAPGNLFCLHIYFPGGFQDWFNSVTHPALFWCS